MKSVSRLLAAIGFAAATTLAAETATQNWMQTYNPGPGYDGPIGTAVDAAGNVIVAGGQQNGDARTGYIAKYAAEDGKLLWSINPPDVSHIPAVDASGNVIVASGNDGRVAKYSGADGKTIWRRPSAYKVPSRMIIDRAGDVVTTGRREAGIAFDQGVPYFVHDFYTAKYSGADGHLIWERQYNGPGDLDDLPHGLALDGSGNVVVTGESQDAEGRSEVYTAKYSAGSGALLWARRYNGPDGFRFDRGLAAATDSEGNVLVTGQANDFDLYVAKYSGSNGAVLWEKIIPPTSGARRGLGIAADPLNNAILVGYDGSSLYVAKFRAGDGALIWAKAYLPAGYQSGQARALLLDPAADIVFIATMNSAASGKTDTYTAKVSGSNGSLVWAKIFDSPQHGDDFIGGTEGSPFALARDGSVAIAVQSQIANSDFEFVTVKYSVSGQSGGAENGELAPTRFTVNGSDKYIPPKGTSTSASSPAAQAATAENGRLDFTAIQTSRIPGLIVQVQYSTMPNDPDSWRALENGNRGRLTRDPETNAFVLDSTTFPKRNGVYFRAYVEAPGYPSDFSNKVGPWDLADTPAALPPTVFRIFGDDTPDEIIPGMALKFAAGQKSQATGLKLRVQYSSAPRQESTWTDMEDGTLAFVKDDFAGDHYLLESNKYPTGRGIYFRVISSAPGFIDSISNIIGPWNLQRNQLPTVKINLAEGQTFSRKGRVPVPYVASDNQGINRVELYVDGELADYSTFSRGEFNLHGLSAGDHSLVAVVYDVYGAIAFSNVIERITLTDEAATIYRRVKDGPWDDASGWQPQALPGPADYVNIPAGRSVSLGRDVFVRFIALYGDLSGPGSLEVNLAMAWFSGHIEGFQLDIVRGAGLVLSGPVAKTQKNVTINNAGKFVVSGKGLQSGTGTVLNNSGTFTFAAQTAEAFKGGAPAAMFHTINQTGGVVNVAGGQLIAPNYLLTAGQLNLGGLIGTDGATLIGTDGATFKGLNGATLIGTDGATLIGTDGATLIGTDGGTLQALNGAGIISQKGAGLIGTDGATLISDNGAAFRATGGTITGFGMLDYAKVINNAAVVHPGRSPGGIGITGNYTQGALASLVLEIGGNDGFAGQYDLLAINGKASLAGELILRSIDGYQSDGSGVVPLGYGSFTGQFDRISANAQVQLRPKGAVVKVVGANGPGPKALNISTRMHVGTDDNVLIAGFIVTGDQPKKVLIRGLGPSLPVNGALADPMLALDGNAVVNDDWRKDQEQAIKDTGIPPSSEFEAAIVTTLAPGPHTAALRGKAGGTGVGLVEVYDLESAKPEQLANISTRGQVLTGDDVMIGGFIIDGLYPAKVLLRAIGPSLPVPGALKDPTLDLVDAQGNIISNDNWRATQEAEIAGVLPPNAEKEAAIVATLVPGSYTAIVRGKDGTTGVALVEGYNLQ